MSIRPSLAYVSAERAPDRSLGAPGQSQSSSVRRSLRGLGLIGGALALALAGCGPLGAPELPWNPKEASLQDVRGVVKSGLISCRQMASRYQLLHDGFDPTFRAVVSWNPQLLADAERLDRVPQGQRGSFHCVPVVIKDNIEVIGLPTTAGARALDGVARSNAEVAQRLITAGALVLGKSNMPDFALDGTNTVSSFGGQTRNPYDQSLTVYGSSGGTAAALTASLGVIGLGTDTSGSLVQPASATGLVAIRPTQGLVPATGIVPLMSLQDMPGPMARTVEDAAAALELLVDSQYAAKGSQSYTSGLSSGALKGLTIGYDPAALQPLPAPPLVPSEDVAALFTQVLQNLAQAGANAKQVSVLGTQLPTLQAAIELSFQCMPVDFKQSLNSHLAQARSQAAIKSLADIIPTRKYQDSAFEFLTQAEAQTDTIQSSTACQKYLEAKAAAARSITALMDKEGVDLLIYPAANQPAYPIGTMPPKGWFGFQALSSNTGLPSLSMPMGRAPRAGAPVGFILLARGYQEAKLIQAAYAYQSRFKPRSAPTATWPTP